MSIVAATEIEAPTTPDLLQEQFASLMKALAEKAKSINAYELKENAELPHKFGSFTFRDLAFPDQLKPTAQAMVNLLSGEVAKKGRVIGKQDRDYKLTIEVERHATNELVMSSLKQMDGATVTDKDNLLRLSLFGLKQRMDFILDWNKGNVQIGLVVDEDEYLTTGSESALSETQKADAFSWTIKFCKHQLETLGTDIGSISFREYKSSPQVTE